MGGICGTHGREEKYRQGYGGETLRKQVTWKTQAKSGAVLK